MPPEVPHVGVESLAARDDEDDAAEDDEPLPPVNDEERNGVRRIDRREDRRVMRDLERTEQRERHEPDDHDGPEDPADARRPSLLHPEEGDSRIATVRGTTTGLSRVVATSSPSTALRTEMAGVMTPSP